MIDLPPPLPPMAPANFGPIPSQNPRSTFHQKAASASWIGFVAACFAGIAMNQTPPPTYRETYLGYIAAKLAVTGILVLGGMASGIIALTGISKHGKKKIIAPAITGIVLNSFFVATVVVLVPLLGHVKADAQRNIQAAATPRVTPQKAADMLVNAPGWVGAAAVEGTTVMVVEVPRGTLISQGINQSFGRDLLCLYLIVNNSRGKEPVTIKAADVSVVLKDGSTQSAMSPQNLFAAAPQKGPDLESAYPDTITVAGGEAKQSTIAAFLPPTIDSAEIEDVLIQVNGNPHTITGRYMDVGEKTRVLRH
jgi:hypothetical protein